MSRRQSESRKRVLLASYHFPPNWEVGARRPYALARFLPEFGWHVTVLTVRDPDEAFVEPHFPYKLPDGLRVTRTPALEIARIGRQIKRAFGYQSDSIPGNGGASRGRWAGALGRRLRDFAYNWLYVPDKKIGWVPFVVVFGLAEVRRIDPQVLITTSPPHSLHLSGYLLSRLTGLPWVADFRDGWTENGLLAPRNLPRRFAFEERLEQAVLRRADRIVTTTVGLRRLFLGKLGPADWPKVRVIPNGFDDLDLVDLPGRNGRFRIALTGRVYPGTLSPLLAGLRRAADLVPEMRDRLELVLMGHFDDWSPELASGRDTIHIRTVPYSSPERAARLQTRSSLLVCAIPQTDNAEAWVPYKLLEYFGRRRPVLFLGPRGEAWDLVVSSGAGWVVEPDDPDGVASAILAAYRAYERNGSPCRFDETFLKQWNARTRVGQFAELLDELLETEAR